MAPNAKPSRNPEKHGKVWVGLGLCKAWLKTAQVQHGNKQTSQFDRGRNFSLLVNFLCIK